MKILRKILDGVKPIFQKGMLSSFYPLYEAIDTFLYTPDKVTQRGPHIRDSIDLKRTMITVVVALLPCIFMALYNTGFQANRAMEIMKITSAPGWRGYLINLTGIGYNPTNVLANILHGLLYFLPVFLVCNIVGGSWEVLFAIVRKHEINEGFLVTGMLFPLILPPTIPLWQVALAISFGVIIGKEVFGGTGKNILNPALTARVFLFFSYPAQITGDKIWTAVDGFSGATPLGRAAAAKVQQISALGWEKILQTTWMDSFLGTIQGSMGETSALACFLGAAILLITGVGSWRIMLSMTLATLASATLLYVTGSSSNPLFLLPPHWHIVLGGFAFAMVFMATDPVSACMTQTGKYFYGALIGFMGIFIRVVNPAYPEGWMLAILFGNIFAPLIDHFVAQANIARRRKRYAQG